MINSIYRALDLLYIATMLLGSLYTHERAALSLTTGRAGGRDKRQMQSSDKESLFLLSTLAACLVS